MLFEFLYFSPCNLYFSLYLIAIFFCFKTCFKSLILISPKWKILAAKAPVASERRSLKIVRIAEHDLNVGYSFCSSRFLRTYKLFSANDPVLRWENNDSMMGHIISRAFLITATGVAHLSIG